jgi:2-amino-4-hydroxy-6-hydroxymethyldihydropteridine diphosphokinase
MDRAYVGLGANVGSREDTLRLAVGLLDDEDGIRVVRISTLRETDAVGVVDQPPFLNGAAEIDTTLGPRELLDVLLRVERVLGRVREGERWGPRTVDLDLLVFGDCVLEEPGLTIPHPRLHERRFALEPLAELDPGLVVPGHGTVSSLLRALDA